jgi:cytochrome c553
MAVGSMIFGSTSWGEDVRNSKHNLVTNSNINAIGTTEVCIFCHTPHGSNTNAPDAAPLWNRDLSTATYQMYTSPNFDGVGIGDAPKGVSLACLSCHDGTVAFDALHNFPGSGSVDKIDFTGPYVDSTNNTFKEGVFPPDPFPNLGPDLRNDHPISMEIPCTKDPQFDGVCANLDGAALGAGKVSFLTRNPTTNPLPGDPRNRLRAYPSVKGKAFIECASCHNPHIGTSESTRFLRLASWDPTDPAYSDTDRNSGSLICLSCHEK